MELARTPGKVTYDANIPHITEATVLDGVSLNQALRYCNWLSKTEGIPPDQWCFLVPEDREADVQLKPNFLSLEGYRLATEAEWEYACRSESVTARPYGNSEALLSKYAWFQDNSEMHAWPPGVLRPNALGLFDMLGNRSEWVHGYYVPHPAPLFGLIFDTESAVGLMPRPTSTNPHYSTRGGFSEGRAAGLRSGRRHYLADKGWATTIRVARTIGAEHSQKR